MVLSVHVSTATSSVMVLPFRVLHKAFHDYYPIESIQCQNNVWGRILTAIATGFPYTLCFTDLDLNIINGLLLCHLKGVSVLALHEQLHGCVPVCYKFLKFPLYGT